MPIESVIPSNHLILYRPLLLLPSIFSSIRVFSNKWALHTRWPKYWSFSFSMSPSNEHSGLISFRMDWFDLPAVQGTLMSLLQSTQLPGTFRRLQRTEVAGASCLGDSHAHAERQHKAVQGETGGRGGLPALRTLACDRHPGEGARHHPSLSLSCP